jgi:hypothetical protein
VDTLSEEEKSTEIKEGPRLGLGSLLGWGRWMIRLREQERQPPPKNHPLLQRSGQGWQAGGSGAQKSRHSSQAALKGAPHKVGEGVQTGSFF